MWISDKSSNMIDIDNIKRDLLEVLNRHDISELSYSTNNIIDKYYSNKI